MSFEYFQELMNDYEKLIKIDKGYDVIIYAGEDEVEIRAHSLILCIRSQYFRTAFSNEWANKKEEKFIINKPNISPQILKIILRYVIKNNLIQFVNINFNVTITLIIIIMIIYILDLFIVERLI
jgi:hypothetical protein